MKNQKPAVMASINVTSLVDVTMVLLIIFMITTPLLRSGIDVALPEATAKALPQNNAITVTLSAEGWLFIEGELIPEAEFEGRLLEQYESNQQGMIFLQAEKTIPYGSVISVMDRIRQLGITNVGLVVEPHEKK
jgi:biopolymer transport protein ExbD